MKGWTLLLSPVLLAGLRPVDSLIFTFAVSSCQVKGPGSVVDACWREDAVQVLLPAPRVQVSEELFHRLKGSYVMVQILQGLRNLRDRKVGLSHVVLKRS